jgi:hypothetical protein
MPVELSKSFTNSFNTNCTLAAAATVNFFWATDVKESNRTKKIMLNFFIRVIF